MTTETDHAVAHADAVLGRQRAVQTRRAYRSRAPRAARNAAIGVASVALIAFIIGLVIPLGITGAMLAVLAMVTAGAALLFYYTQERQPRRKLVVAQERAAVSL